MKLKEALAEDAHYIWAKGVAAILNKIPSEQELRNLGVVPFNVGYLAGFEKAREMARELAEREGFEAYIKDPDAWEQIAKLGEEEV